MKLAWKKFVRSCQVCLFLAGFRRMKTLWIPGVTPQITPDWPWRADSSMLGEYQLDWPEMSIDAPSLHRYLSCNILTSPFWSNLTTPSWLSMDSRLPVESRSSPGKNYTFIFIAFVKCCCKYRIKTWKQSVHIYYLKLSWAMAPSEEPSLQLLSHFGTPCFDANRNVLATCPSFSDCLFVKIQWNLQVK